MQTICHRLKTKLTVALSFAILANLTPQAPLLVPAFAADTSASASLDGSDDSDGNNQDVDRLETILNKSLTALGGEDGIAKLASNYCVYGKEFDRPGSFEEVAKLSSQSTGSSSYRLLRKGAKWRFDHERAAGSSTSGGTAGGVSTPDSANNWTEGFNGEVAWVQSGGKAEDALIDNAKLLNLESTLPASFLLEAARALSSPGKEASLKVELGPRTDYHDSKCFPLIFISPSSGETFTLYVDTKNYTVQGLKFMLGGDPKAASAAAREVQILYSEYRPVAGSLYPFKEVRMLNSRIDHVYVTSDVNVTQTAADHDFDKPGGSSRLSKTIVIPFDYAQKEILIKGRLNNGEELDFLFDTGASDTIIDRRVAAENFLLKEGVAEMSAMSGRVTTNTSTIGRLELGNLIVNDIDARMLDLSSQSRHLGRRLGGIIGTNVISRFVVAIDYAKGTLTVNDADSFVRPTDVVAVSFLRKSAPVVKVRLGGAGAAGSDVMMLVDTGAAFNNLPAAVAGRFASAQNNGSSGHMTEGEGLDGRPVRLGKVTIDSVSLAGRPVRKVEFTYTLPYPASPNAASASSSAAAGSATKDGGDNGGFFQTTNLGILGNPFLENFICIIDYKFQRMLLKGSAALKLRSDIEQSIESGDKALVEKREFRGAEAGYQRALLIATANGDRKNEARVLGRIGSLRRIMAKDLNRPEHSKASYDYFVKAQEMAKKAGATEVEGRILADWSLLYLDNGQMENAKQTMDRALVLAPQDADVLVDCAVHLSRSRRFPEMQRYVEKALFLDPSNWQALWYQVKLSETFGDSAKMVATLKDIVRYFPWSKIAQDKLRVLEAAPAAGAGGAAAAVGAQAQTPGSAVVTPNGIVGADPSSNIRTTNQAVSNPSSGTSTTPSGTNFSGRNNPAFVPTRTPPPGAGQRRTYR